MRRADRPDPPASVYGKDKRADAELKRVRERFEKGTLTGKSFSVYKDDRVKAALEQVFHGKCAYCETIYQTQAPVDVEHFRPKGRVEGTDHDGYWWLGMKWENLLPSCLDCNRKRRQITPKPTGDLKELAERSSATVNTGKLDSFPILGTRAESESDNLAAEDPVLLDPTQDQPKDHIRFHIDREHMLALAIPVGMDNVPITGTAEEVAAATPKAAVRGAVSIQVYGLNRLGLLQARTRVLRRLEFYRSLIERIDMLAVKLAAHPDPEVAATADQLTQIIHLILSEINEMRKPEAEYSSLVNCWCDAYLASLKP
ncbi:endonuclease [Shimia ponticola]|uniref:endonuclease n=1 Tax=Shimia ponticola TaxID=2582893 RepID=UPI0011BE17F3|nr:endonuclease [Shimia ponticola]